jgi:hypothetical protein
MLSNLRSCDAKVNSFIPRFTSTTRRQQCDQICAITASSVFLDHSRNVIMDLYLPYGIVHVKGTGTTPPTKLCSSHVAPKHYIITSNNYGPFTKVDSTTSKWILYLLNTSEIRDGLLQQQRRTTTTTCHYEPPTTQCRIRPICP